jgi:excisionase family DNA binding protein
VKDLNECLEKHFECLEGHFVCLLRRNECFQRNIAESRMSLNNKSQIAGPSYAHSSEGFYLLKTNQAATFLNIGTRTLQERVAAREITAVKIGKSIRFDLADLKAYAEKCKIKAIGWKEAK